MNEKQHSILIVDDHQDIREVVRVLLEADAFEVREAANGEEAIRLVQAMAPDLVIMDVMMPGLSGFQTVGKIRDISRIPILFLTARSSDQDKVLAYSAGGDDYLQKPFSEVELLTKVRALLRRYHIYQGSGDDKVAEEPQLLSLRELTVSSRRNEVYLGKDKLNLTETEYAILRLLMRQIGHVFTAEEIFETVWHEPYLQASNNTIMVHIRNLRKKIQDDPRDPRFIRTVWGKGYRIE